ncbi:hypothetical protein ABIB83_008956 [Bradyrhizobium sp. I1.8.5]|uniref:hypothetical protein n=1 Tax=Bradyrhizobium sp. I1.8.5 TaxID=3156365 RepID=UPI0033969121
MPIVIDVPGFVGDDEIVVGLFHRLLEVHEILDQDLVHPSQRLETICAAQHIPDQSLRAFWAGAGLCTSAGRIVAVADVQDAVPVQAIDGLVAMRGCSPQQTLLRA